MATSKDLNQTVNVDFAQTGAENLQKTLAEMLRKIESIQTEGKKASPAVKDLATNLKTLSTSLKNNDLGSEDWVKSFEKIKAVMATIKTLGSGLKLFDKTELEEVTRQLKEQARIAKEVQSQNSYQANLRAAYNKRIADEEVAAQRALERANNKRIATQVADESSYQATLRKNWDAQMERERKLAQAEQDRIQKKVQSERNAQVDARARYDANQAKTGQTAEERAGSAAQDERNYQANLRARYEAQQAREAAQAEAARNRPTRGQAAIQSRAELATGDGAASLLLIQGALMANSALINGAINAIKQTITFSIELEAAFRNVQAVVGTTKTEMIGLEDTIKKVSTSTKFSALEVAEAALTLGQAGLSAKQIAESIQPVVTLANAAGSSIAQAVDLVTSVVGVFDKNASDVGDIANKITQAANGSKVSVDKLALGFQYAGNTAAQLGISFEEVTAAMAAMSNAGIKSGSTMGTGLRQFLVEVQKPSEDFLKILSRLGLSISDLDFKSKGFIGVVRTLKEAGFVASDAIQSFDVRGAAAFNALLARPDDLQAQYDSLGGSQAAMKANEIQMDSLAAQSARLTNSLGNLASTGFDPVIKTLTGFTRLLGDGLGVVSEWGVLLKVLGTALAGLAAGAAVAWIGQLVVGFQSLMAFLPGLIAGTTALAGGLSTLMIVSGVGVAVVAAVAAFTAYNYITGETTRTLDQTQAAMSKAAGAATEKEEAIKSLNNRLEMLTAREGEVKEGSAAFNTIISEGTELIARWGYTIDNGASSLGNLAARLRVVRGELEKMRLGDMAQIVSEATVASNITQKELQVKSAQAQKVFSPYGAGILGANKFAGQDDFLKSLTPERRTMAEKVLKQIASGQGADAAMGPEASQVVGWMSTFRAGRGNVLGAGQTDFDSAQAALQGLTSKAGEARAATTKLRTSEADLNKNTAIDNLKKTLRDQGIDIDQLGIKNLADTAKRSLSPEDQKNAVKITEATRTLVEQRKAQLEGMKTTALRAAMNDDEKQVIETAFRAAAERTTEPLRQSLPAAQSQLEIEKKLDPSEARLTRLKKNLGAKGGGSAADLEEAKNILRARGDAEFNRMALGQEPDMRAASRVEIDRKVEEQIGSLVDSVQRSGAAAATSALKSQESSYRALAEAKMKDAKSSRGRATANMSLEDLSNLMDEGLSKIADAKKIEVDSIARQYAPGSIEYKNLNEAAEEKYTAAAATFVGSFSGLIETTTERVVGISKAVKKIDAAIKKMTNDAEDALFAAQGELRANNVEAARNSGAVSGRNRSEADTFLTTNKGYGLSLESTQRDMASKTIQQASITSSRDIIAKQTEDNRARMESLTSKLETLMGGREASQLKGGDQTEFVKLSAELKVVSSAVAEGDNKVEGYTNKIQALRKEIEELNLKAVGLTEGAARPQTWDELANSMDKVLQAYTKISAQQDVFVSFENGLMGVFKGLGGQFSTFLTDISSGTKTVGEAFRTMAMNIIKSMMDVLAQALAMQAVKSILGAFTGSGSATGGNLLSSGGSSNPYGFISTIGGMFIGKADGGPITGGIAGKDSVPIAGMPGEYVLKKSAVDAVGQDYLDQLNSQTVSTVQSSSSGTKAASSGGGKVVNVWVVTPDQMDETQAGPDDVVAAVSDNIARGGSLKKLIQQVQMGL